MAGTASPRSEPPAGIADRRQALAWFLVAASGADAVEIEALLPLAGGAIQENWALDARFAGGVLAGDRQLVLRAAGSTGIPSSLGRSEEFSVLKAAFAAGVTVPEPLFACPDAGILGKPFLIMRRAAGTAAAHRITRDRTLDPALPAIAERLGRELARIHAIRPPRPDLAFLPPYAEDLPARQIARFRAYLDRHPMPRPALEWGMRWLATHLPAPAAPVLCHRDFRTGNYLLDGAEVTGILDWEFAGWGDPHEDIGWFCSKGWRFARLDREAGGIADRASFYRGYQREAGHAIDPQRVFFWEVMASVRWAVIALQQSDRHILAGERNLDLALTGRRASECELEILMLLDPCSAPRATSFDEQGSAVPSRGAPGTMCDLPSGPELLGLARAVLLDELLPLLPAERRFDALLVGNCLAIAEREGAAGNGPAVASAGDLEMLYGSDGVPPSSAAGRSRLHHRGASTAPESEGLLAGTAETHALWRRFARDLRIGAFESLQWNDSQARAILWRLTIAKLRLANPKFVDANGLA
jgi:aminoglycoside phosphotransferase (APT) family kinase protein